MKRVTAWLVLPLVCIAFEAACVAARWPQLGPRLAHYHVLADLRR
jgi:hypothetical protein